MAKIGLTNDVNVIDEHNRIDYEVSDNLVLTDEDEQEIVDGAVFSDPESSNLDEYDSSFIDDEESPDEYVN